MWRNNAYLQTTGLLISVCFLSACQPETQSTPNVKFSAPTRILQARAVDKSQLRPVVRLSNRTSIEMQKTGDNTWSGTINVQPNRSYAVSINWIEKLPSGDLLLASWSDEVAVDDNGAQVNVSDADEYNYAHDIDSDSITNIQERENDTDPFSFTAIMTNSDDAQADTGGSSEDAGNTDEETDSGTTTDGEGTTTESNTTEGTATEGIGEVTDGDGTTTEGMAGTTAGTATEGLTAGETDDGETDADETDGDDGSTDGGSDGNQTRALVLIPRILPRQAPEIDGLGVQLSSRNTLIGEWQNAVQSDQSGDGLWINRLMISNDSNEDDAVDGEELHRWAAMHDGVNLYVVVLSDDVGKRSSDSNAVYRDDALELFIDGNNSQLTKWGDDDDFHYLIALQQLNSKKANSEIVGRVDLGPSPTSEPFNFEFSTGPDKGPAGIRNPRIEQDVYELSIPIDEAGITIGETFGFEVQLDDDDNDDDRDSKWGWAHPSRQDKDRVDDTYLNPSVMGRLILEE